MIREVLKNISIYYESVRTRKITALFEVSGRFENFSAAACGLFLDFSKTNIDQTSKELLIEFVSRSGVYSRREKMFSGAAINKSENRTVLHWALRADRNKVRISRMADIKLIDRVSRNIAQFADEIRMGKITSISGEKFTDIINIGIGGSDLGAKMSVRALTPYHDGPRCHFVSNVDSADLTDKLMQICPKTTLVIISSKTFTTTETMTNARSIISWLKNIIPNGFEQHLVAISSNPGEAFTYGITPDRVFNFPDSIGGRYSMWGPIGLPIMIAIGVDNFNEFLLGACEMDNHFLHENPNKNLPILLAMVGIWHRNICRYSARAILPYEQRLSDLPNYLQQLDMESNGKSVNIDGNYLETDTVPIVWGESGTNGQHAFYQMLHQGSSIVPCEFLIGASGHEPDLAHHHELLLASCLAQSEALMVGRDYNKNGAERHREFPGNRPSVTIAYSKLTPKVLGSLIALFEHRTFVEGVVWGVNSFDQWGVEFGKDLSNELLPFVRGHSSRKPSNPSTAGLLKKLQEM